jgi:adenosylcobinamide kinase / adenosylcobinamide-phosphate guanylyltransferase
MEKGMTLVIGGARSGKSSFAQSMAEEDGGRVCFMATATAGDHEMEERIKYHRLSRPSHWKTLELEGGLRLRGMPGDTDLILFDCFTVYLSNLMASCGLDWPLEDEDKLPEFKVRSLMAEAEAGALRLIDDLRGAEGKLIVVSNEVGMGVVPAFRLGRVFRDLAGRLNQALAARADRVYFVMAGLPVCLKTPERGEGLG